MNNSKPKNGIASIPNKFLVVAVAFLGSVFLFAGITHETVIEKEELFDQSLKNFSFPSGHALSSFIFCSILSYLVFKSQLRPFFKWTITALLLILSLLIGVSRIILRMHYATDVIAGFCLGIAWVIISFWVMQKMEEKKKSSTNIG